MAEPTQEAIRAFAQRLLTGTDDTKWKAGRTILDLLDQVETLHSEKFEYMNAIGSLAYTLKDAYAKGEIRLRGVPFYNHSEITSPEIAKRFLTTVPEGIKGLIEELNEQHKNELGTAVIAAVASAKRERA